MEKEKIERWMDEGKLLSPVDSRPCFLDLVHAVKSAIGLAGTTRPIYLPRRQHIVLVLIDGMGEDQINSEKTPFLERYLAGSLRAIFPSTTAVVLTSLCTASWPSDHSISGWWTSLNDEHVALPLPFLDRATQKSLDLFGFSFENLTPLSSWWKKGKRRWLCLQPQHIVGTTFSTFFCGGCLQRGYRTLSEAIEICKDHWSRADAKLQPSMTYLYFPKLDSLSHKYGPQSPEVSASLCEIDDQMRALSEALPKDSILLITADHGHATSEDSIWWDSSDPLLSMLKTAPTGEPSVPIFHVQEGAEEEFKNSFLSRYGDFFALLTPDELAEFRLFGPRRLSSLFKSRLGNFVGISVRPCSLYVEGIWGGPEHVGIHGGLRPSEMQIPWIVFEHF